MTSPLQATVGNGKPVTLGYEYGWDLLHRNVESHFHDVPKVHQGLMLTEGVRQTQAFFTGEQQQWHHNNTRQCLWH